MPGEVMIQRHKAPRPATVSVRKRRRGYIVDVSVPALTGRKRYRQAFEKKAEADAHADAIRARLRDGLPAFETPEERRAPVTVGDVLRFYEERHLPEVASPASRARLVTHREAIEKSFLAAREAEAVTLDDLEQFKS